jgi:hypothetical protein
MIISWYKQLVSYNDIYFHEWRDNIYCSKVFVVISVSLSLFFTKLQNKLGKIKQNYVRVYWLLQMTKTVPLLRSHLNTTTVLCCCRSYLSATEQFDCRYYYEMVCFIHNLQSWKDATKCSVNKTQPSSQNMSLAISKHLIPFADKRGISICCFIWNYWCS